MDPFQMIPFGQPISSMQPFNGLIPQEFPNSKDDNDIMASLDSDTRAYVEQHTGEDRTRGDVIDCINELHGAK